MIGGQDLTAGLIPSSLNAGSSTYTTVIPYTLIVTVLATDVTGTISNSINFTAVSN